MGRPTTSSAAITAEPEIKETTVTITSGTEITKLSKPKLDETGEGKTTKLMMNPIMVFREMFENMSQKQMQEILNKYNSKAAEGAGEEKDDS